MIIREMFLNQNSSWAEKAVQKFMDHYGVRFVWGNKKLVEELCVENCNELFWLLSKKIDKGTIKGGWCILV